MITVYLHPRCIDSYNVYKHLVEKNYLARANIVNTEVSPLLALEKSVLGVPAFELNGEVVLQGWFELSDVDDLFLEGSVSINGFEEGFERLLKSVWSTFTVASMVYVSGSLEVLASMNKFLLSASGGYFLEDKKGFLSHVKRRLNSTEFNVVERGLLRSILGNFLRDVFWTYKETPDKAFIENLGYREFRKWMFWRASVGRVYVPQSLNYDDSRLKTAWEYVLERADRVGPKIVEEYEKLKGFRI